MTTPLPPRKSNFPNEFLMQSSKKAKAPARISEELNKILQVQSDLLKICSTKLESQNSSKLQLKQQLDSINSELSQTLSENNSLEHQRTETLKDLSHTLNELKSLNSEIEFRKHLLDSDLSGLEEKQLELISQKNLVMRQKETQEKVLGNLREQILAANKQFEDLSEKENIFEDILSSYQNSIHSYQKKREQAYLEIKTLNNHLQELKGNIRVFCKIRPILPQDQNLPQRMDLTEKSITIHKADKKSKFFFDQVFTPNTTNDEIFEEISQLVQSALDGYKVCIFAYGQTGSGKTYTMEGGQSGPKGIIQKSVELMFSSQSKLEELGWNFSFKASAIEIYNEQVRDLFDCRKVLTAFSTNLIYPHTVPIFSYDELAPLLARARRCRAEAETECNTHSSRSHFLFRVEIQGVKENAEVCGVLNMIDLAGSERLKKSKVQGERLEETKAINKSLSALGSVIHALVKKESHIPYRNSKLTSILQNCLGGDGKTLMFVNISPLACNLKETLNSLIFAQKVNACTLE